MIVAGFALVALLVVLDQWSKAAVFEWLVPGSPSLVLDVHGHRRHVLAGEWLSFMTSCNWGAAFGFLDQYPRALLGGRVVAIVFLGVLLLRADTRHRVVFLAMALVLAGATGNVIDNLWTGCDRGGRPYGVRDFINVWFEPIVSWDAHFPSFNVADACISVGACVWVSWGLLSGSSGGDAEEATDAAEPATDAPVSDTVG